jgi:hypothetical protein
MSSTEVGQMTAPAGELLRQARSAVVAAGHSQGICERHTQAHRAAVHAAAALVAVRSAPGGGPAQRSVWDLLVEKAPELAEWAAFFAAATRRPESRARGELVSAREADDLLRQAEAFVGLVTRAIGLPVPPPRSQVLVPAVRA